MEEDFDRIQRDLNEILVDLQRAARKRFNRMVDDAIDTEVLLRFARQMGGFSPMPGQSGDPYRVLGLERSASDEEVRKRYRELVNILHPDKSGTPGTATFFKMVNDAFQSISRERGC